MFGDWVVANEKLPEPETVVLVAIEHRQIEIAIGDSKEMWPETPYFHLGLIVAQFSTGDPVWVSHWGHELLESDFATVVYWIELPELPTEGKRNGKP